MIILEPLLVIVRRFLKCLPLLTIVTKDDERHMLALDQTQEFARAGAQLLFVVIIRRRLTIRGKQALQGYGIDRQQNIAGLRQTHQYRLMSRDMSTALDQRKSRP